MNKKPDYANWIPKKLIAALGGGGALFLLLFLLSFLLEGSLILTIGRVIFVCLAIFFIGFCLYMQHARTLLSYEGGGIQGKILDNVVSHLEWDGNGTLLDIGCGSGAMAIKAEKRYPTAQIVGMDYWGIGWDYAKSQCESNAEIEKVSERVRFQKGDASKLDFADDTFDAAISNFVFHVVRSQPDKLALIREAFRVIKPGGVFSFEDVFFAKGSYPDLDGLIAALTKDVAELHFVDTRNSEFVPKFLSTPMVAGNMGLIYGKK